MTACTRPTVRNWQTFPFGLVLQINKFINIKSYVHEDTEVDYLLLWSLDCVEKRLKKPLTLFK